MIGIPIIGVYLYEKGTRLQILSVYRSTAQLFPVTVVSARLCISQLTWYGYLLVVLIFCSVDDIRLSDVVMLPIIWLFVVLCL